MSAPEPDPHRRPPTLFDVGPGAHEPLADLANAAGAGIEDRLHAPRRPQRRWAAYAFLLLAIVGAAYLVCFLALTRALRVLPVGVAYAIWSGVGMALITLIAFLVFGQALSVGELAGIALILAGVVIIQLFSRAQAH